MTSPPSSSGLLVLGMHRSGTSALARVLHLCGADIGSRVLGESAGNEAGHWEDALAVEIHERLLDAHGTRWDEALGLPSGILAGDATMTARREIRAYITEDRVRHPLWVVKDPRLSLFADLWIDEAVQAGQGVGTVLMLRHPMEVARSLAARDGIAHGRALLLWLDYSLAAAAAVERTRHTLITYDQLLEDWRGCIGRIQRLPGGSSLRVTPEVEGEVDRFLDGTLRHHRDAGEAPLPEVVQQAWDALGNWAVEGAIAAGSTKRLLRRLAPVRQLVQPLLGEMRVTQRKLWERIARAEAPLAEAAATDLPARLVALQEAVSGQGTELGRIQPRLDGIETGLQGVADQVEVNRSALVTAISEDLQRMQAVTADAVKAAGVREREAELARQVEPRLHAFEQELMPLAKRMPAEFGALAEEVAQQRAAVIEAISVDLKQMQRVTAEALQAAAAREAEAAMARQIAPRLQVLEGELLPLAQRALDQSREMAELRRESRAAAAASAAEIDALRARLATTESTAEGRQATIGQLQQALDEQRSETLRLQQVLDEQRSETLRLQQALDEQRSETLRLQHDAAGWRADAEMLRMVRQSRSWRMTRPFRSGARLLTGNAEKELASFRQAARRVIAGMPFLSRGTKAKWVGRTLQPGSPRDPATLPDAQMARLVELQPANPGFADVFIWSVIDWNFRIQRPQHLARALAERGHRVFYISNNFVDAAEPGFRLEPLDPSGRLFQVNLNLAGAPPIYYGLPSGQQVAALQRSLAEVLAWSETQASMSIVQHPYWTILTRAVPNARVVYDCMDHHAGFENNAPAIMEAESRIIADADLVIVTSAWLETELGPKARATALIRNAGEFDHFSQVPDRVFADARDRRVIGYYGAIAEWFDPGLVRAVALAHPDALVLLIGSDTAGVKARLSDLPNVEFTGEVPYSDLPYWLHGFDVCLLPFKVIPLTMATNPVKVYEYLAAGKPVVSVDLPEMAQFGRLVETASDPGDFADAVGRMLVQGRKRSRQKDRQAFAAGQTWAHRARALDQELDRLAEPRVSVIVLTFNNLGFTQACLSSLEAFSGYDNLEVIVVDNASSDGSREWLAAWAAEPSAAGHVRRLILNDGNLGFSAGNNVGLRAATGEFLVILNNDTYVTPGWVRTLCAHLRRDPALGLVGPVTNNIGNEARIEIHYSDMSEMIERAGRYTRAHPGHSFPMRNAAFFCVAMTRRAYEAVGDMDEDFGVGFFEDDDYCRRMEQAGFGIACAEDVFIHHHLSASFEALGSERKRRLFERNKAIYEAKWGPWEPHIYRGQAKAPAPRPDRQEPASR